MGFFGKSKPEDTSWWPTFQVGDRVRSGTYSATSNGEVVEVCENGKYKVKFYMRVFGEDVDTTEKVGG